MDSPQSVVSPLKNFSISTEPEKQNNVLGFTNPSNGSVENAKDFIGVVSVHIHQARDIQNICIYHKQDVYAKLYLTTDPKNTTSTQIINGGGKNPVFNEHHKLNVKTIDSSLKCEVWMLSRVRNYLEDQLLGFALVPLSEILLENGKIEKEFSLSSTDLFHSPAGFVQLSLSYSGASPEVIEVSPPLATESNGKDCELDKIEFPDPKLENENHMMVSEYTGIPCTDLDSHSSDNESSEIGVRMVESFSTGTVDSFVQVSKQDSDSCQSSDTQTQEFSSPPKENNPKEMIVESGDSESINTAVVKPLVTVNIEPENNVVQQDYVDMYMKSMQQFTESLAKMNLPLDIENGPTSSGDSSTDRKVENTPKSNGSRVFYGSRAFF
jgi:hypothetical protein